LSKGDARSASVYGVMYRHALRDLMLKSVKIAVVKLKGKFTVNLLLKR